MKHSSPSPRHRHNRLAVVTIGIAACTLAACASMSGSESPRAVAGALARQPVALLGEVHDNPHHHRLRYEAIKAAIEGDASGRYRPAILMEQFDRERQSDIDRARRERPRDADHLIAAAAPAPTRPGGQGWNWTFYKPFVELALQYDLPLIAANASRGDLMKVSSGGFATLFTPEQMRSLGLDRPVPVDIQSGQEREIAIGHCNALPAGALAPMARAQVARDAFMALKVAEYAPRGAVLLAGNGHVRRDIGVPRWLAAAPAPLVVTYLEAAPAQDADGKQFDRAVVTAKVDRPDPCEAFLKSRKP